jgi:hypothetical protein
MKMHETESAKTVGSVPTIRVIRAGLARGLWVALMISHQDALAATATWTGEAANDLMSEPFNWGGQTPPGQDTTQIVFGPLAPDAHTTVGVDLADTAVNVGPIVLAEGAPPMTLRAVPPNQGHIQLAHTLEPLRIVNRSGQTQTFQLQLHAFWHDEGGNVPARRWEAASGAIEFLGAVVLRGDLTPPGQREVIWELAATSDMTFHQEVLPSDGWHPDTAISLVKSGPGRVTFQRDVRWNGTAVAAQGILAPEARWKISGNLLIEPEATLEGRGTIDTPVEVQGRLGPGGNDIATLTFNKGLKLTGVAELGVDAKAQSSDRASISSGPLTYGGILRVTSTGQSSDFTRGQVFRLFEWQEEAPTGAFEKLELPPLPSGLSWTDKLAEDGSLVVGP